METITSLQNPRIQQLRRLNTAKARADSGLMLIEGMKMLREAVDAGFYPDTLLVEDSVSDPEVRSLMDRVPGSSAPRVLSVPRRIIEAVADTRTPQPILASVPLPALPFALTDSARLVLLDGVQDPGNAGTIWRTAEAAGFTAIVFGEGCADSFSPKCVRATMGSAFRLPVYSTNLYNYLTQLRDRGFCVLVSALDGDAFDAAPVSAPLALVIGSEGAGVGPEVSGLATRRIRIPMRGQTESLNAAVAAGILLFFLRETM